jgi:hypothetical protein
VGVVRVGRTGNREGERLVSPSEQRERSADACARDRLELVEVVEEVSRIGHYRHNVVLTAVPA